MTMHAYRGHPDIELTSPQAVLTAIPHLLGFVPCQSLVLMWITRSRLALTQRIDLPTGDLLDVALLEGWLLAAEPPVALGQADEVIAVFVTDRIDLDGLSASLVARLRDRGVGVRDAVRLQENRWWSYLCSDNACCPADGRLLDPVDARGVLAEFVGFGSAPLPGREYLLGEVTAEPGRVRAARAALRDMEWIDESPETWRDRCIDIMCTSTHTADIADIAASIAGAHDLHVRDTVLWEMVRMDSDRLRATGEFLRASTRCAGRRGRLRVAPIATLAGSASWLLGDGARALTAIDLALKADPSYSLAEMLSRALRVGLHPRVWRSALEDLGRDACRYGVGHVRRDSVV